MRCHPPVTSLKANMSTPPELLVSFGPIRWVSDQSDQAMTFSPAATLATHLMLCPS
jgi:hypothetical protein